MNTKRYLQAAIALFAFIFIYEWIMHGYLFSGLYQETASVWRNYDEMMANFPLSMLFQLVLSFWTAFIFTQIYPEGGINKGLLFGIFFGVFSAIMSASWYLWVPITATLATCWFFSSIVEGVIGGIILGALYRR